MSLTVESAGGGGQAQTGPPGGDHPQRERAQQETGEAHSLTHAHMHYLRAPVAAIAGVGSRSPDPCRVLSPTTALVPC